MNTARRTPSPLCGPLLAAAGTRLCHLDDIDDGDARAFLPAPTARCKVIVVRQQRHLHGWLDSCPHYTPGTPMAWRTDAYLDGERRYLCCHAHGALFEISTGRCVRGPCLGRALRAVPLQLDRAGNVIVVEDISEDIAVAPA